MSISDPTSPIAAQLRRRRKQLNLTQQDLAELAGVSLRFIHDLENGKPTVRLERVLAVAKTLGYELRLVRRDPGG